MPITRQGVIQTVKPYKFSKNFALISVYDGNSFLNTFVSSCNTVNSMTVENQQILLILYIKNKLRGKIA